MDGNGLSTALALFPVDSNSSSSIGDGHVLLEEFKAFVGDAYLDDDLNSLFYTFFRDHTNNTKAGNSAAATFNPGATVDFFDFVNFALLRHHTRKATASRTAAPLQIEKPEWALPVTAPPAPSSSTATRAKPNAHLFAWQEEIMISIMPTTAISALRYDPCSVFF